MATAGIVCGSIALALSLVIGAIYLAIFVVGVGAASTAGPGPRH